MNSQEFLKAGIPMVYETGFRLRLSEKALLEKKGYHVYERRYTQDRKITIENKVIVDFESTMITNFPVPLERTIFKEVYDGEKFLTDIGASRVYKIEDLLDESL